MIDTFQAKTSGKKLVVKISGIMVQIGEPQPGKKPKLVDIAMGDPKAIIADLRSNGYQVSIMK